VVALAEQEREREAGQNDECDRDEVEEHPGFAGTRRAPGGLGGHSGPQMCDPLNRAQALAEQALGTQIEHEQEGDEDADVLELEGKHEQRE